VVSIAAYGFFWPKQRPPLNSADQKELNGTVFNTWALKMGVGQLFGSFFEKIVLFGRILHSNLFIISSTLSLTQFTPFPSVLEPLKNH
jgi:hypothetical protein